MSKTDSKTLFTLLDGVWSDIGVGDTITLTPMGNESEDHLVDSPSVGIDRYDKRQLLGEGGMGAVHEAYDKVLHRPVATKSLHEEVSVRSSLWKRFY